MRIQVFVRTVVLVGLSALTFPATARAGSITIQNISKFTGVGTGYFFTDIVYPTGEPNAGQPVPLGAVLGSVTMSDGSELNARLNAPNEFEAYCADILGPVEFRKFETDAPPVYTAIADEMINWQAPSALNTDGARQRASWLYSTYAETFSDDQLLERTALQMAIWEVLYDQTLSVVQGDGRFYVAAANTAVTMKATEYLTQLQLPINAADVLSANAAWIRLSANGDESIQDFIGPVESATPVPEPGAGMLLGMGIASLAAFRSRKSLLRRD